MFKRFVRKLLVPPDGQGHQPFHSTKISQSIVCYLGRIFNLQALDSAEAQAALGVVAGPVVFTPGDGTPGDGLARLSATIRTPGGVVTL